VAMPKSTINQQPAASRQEPVGYTASHWEKEQN